MNIKDNDPIGRIIRYIVVIGCFIAGMSVSFSACKRIDAGHVGIRVSYAGSSRGVQNAPIVTGWVVFNPLTEKIVEFPTSIQNEIWSHDLYEGRSLDESITFASREGVTINADVAIAYHVEARLAPQLYNRFRQDNIRTLTDGYIRNLARDMLNESASTRTVQDIYGNGKSALLHETQRALNERLNPDGFFVDQLSFTAALRLPDNVVQAINLSIAASQQAIQAQNRVAQVEAEARQRVAEAEGRANAARAAAHGDADALLIRTHADAENREIMAHANANANNIIRPSLTPEVMNYLRISGWIGRWNGSLPAYMGPGAQTLLSAPMPTP